MVACEHISLFFYQDDGAASTRLTLTQIHADGSEERITHRLRIDAVRDHTDLEDLARQVFAAAIEVV